MAVTVNGDLHATIQELSVEIAVLKTKLDEREKQLVRQEGEWSRRLDILNHADREAKEVLAQYGSTYLTQMIFATFREGYDEWRATVDIALAKDEGRRASYTAIVAFIVSIASFGVALLKYFMV